MHEYLIALGANLNDREYYIERAKEAIHSACGPILSASKLRETVAMGAATQAFLNAAVVCSSCLEPSALLQALLAIEVKLGRIRTIRWGNRTIDLDIIFWKNPKGLSTNFRTEQLCIPHPNMHERRFVLEPAADIAGDWLHPELGLTIAELFIQLKNQP